MSNPNSRRLDVFTILSASSEKQAGFAEGYLAALKVYGLADPDGEGDMLNIIIKDIKRQIARAEQENQAAVRSEIEEAFQDSTVKEKTIESFVSAKLDANHVDENGICYTADSQPAEDDHLQPIGEKDDWKNRAIYTADGKQISQEEFSKLPNGEKKKCTSVNYIMMFSKLMGGLTKILVTDRAYAVPFTKYAIEMCPTRLKRFICETGIAPDGKTKGKFYDVRDVVAAAAEERHPLIFNGALAKQIKGGNITSVGELNIALLEHLALNIDDDVLPKLNEKILEFCMSAVEALDDVAEFDRLFPKQSRLTYRDSNGAELKRMIINSSNEFVRSDNTAFDADEQTNYLIYLVRILAGKLDNAFVKNPKANVVVTKETRPRLLKIACKATEWS